MRLQRASPSSTLRTDGSYHHGFGFTPPRVQRDADDRLLLSIANVHSRGNPYVVMNVSVAGFDDPSPLLVLLPLPTDGKFWPVLSRRSSRVAAISSG